MKKPILPPTYFLVAIAVMAVLHFVLPVLRWILYPWNLLGCLPLAVGIGFNLLADRAFKEKKTTVKPFQKSTILVTTGVFRVSRHPMYLGMVMVLAGVGILMGSITPLLIVLVFAILMETNFVRVEEKMLEDTFGTDWISYKQSVRKWV